MKSKGLIIIGLLLSIILLAGACSTGFLVGSFVNSDRLPLPQSNNPSETQQPGDKTLSGENLQALQEAWQIIQENYVDQPVDEKVLLKGALHGMVNALGDEHSSYMDAKEFTDWNVTLSGEYEGIGALVSTEGEYLTITEPFPDSPAFKAGLLPGDQIIAVDGEDMTGVLPELVRQKVLGPKGSTVVLTIRREDKEPFDVSITRARVLIPSIEARMLDGNIAYIRLRTFGQRSGDELHAALEDMLKQNPKGLIFDLRNNGGGLLSTAVQVSSEFLSEGVVVYEQYQSGERNTLSVKPGGLATKIPMVVLVNEFSASASEIVAGAIQDYQRASLVGTVTFGKGTVQQLHPLSNDKGAVRVTIARWLTPKEHTIHKIGITPDVTVERSEEDMKAGRDPQLDKAVEILQQK